HHAAGVLVEPVDDPDARVGDAGRGQTKLSAEPLQDAVGLGPPGNGREPGGLANGDVVVVLPENVEPMVRHRPPACRGRPPCLPSSSLSITAGRARGPAPTSNPKNASRGYNGMICPTCG